MREEREMWDRVIHGDCLEVMRGMPDCSFDACVVDPPYGFGEVKDIAGLLQAWMQDEDDSHYLGKGGFMNAQWDSGVPGPRYWREVYRVLKPGSHIVAFSSTRTYDLLVIALRLANFQIKDTIIWCHGQGFPKSLNLGNGRGTALKPAIEPICLARKPLSEPTIASNVLRWNGCGALNIDQCRVGLEGIEHHRTAGSGAIGTANGIYNSSKDPINRIQQEREQQGLNPRYDPSGRFPSHLLLSHDPRCIARGTKRVRGNGAENGTVLPRKQGNTYRPGSQRSSITHRDEHGLEEVQDFECHPSCPVRVLGEQSGESKSKSAPRGGTSPNPMSWGEKRKDGDKIAGHEDEGSKARYFQQFHDPLSSLEAPFHYFSKSSRRDRNSGLEGMPTSASSRYGKMNGTSEHAPKYDTPEQNTHPTCKSTSLMAWLCRLVGVPGGVILDPFGGSGSTAVACIREGFHFILVEQEQEYVNIARARIVYAQQEAKRAENERQEWECVDGCPIKVLEKQSKGTRAERSSGGHQRHNTGNGHGFIANGNECESSGYDDSKGGASRYFTQLPPEPICLWDLLEESGS